MLVALLAFAAPVFEPARYLIDAQVFEVSPGAGVHWSATSFRTANNITLAQGLTPETVKDFERLVADGKAKIVASPKIRTFVDYPSVIEMKSSEAVNFHFDATVSGTPGHLGLTGSFLDRLDGQSVFQTPFNFPVTEAGSDAIVMKSTDGKFVILVLRVRPASE